MILKSPSGSYKLERTPKTNKGDLRPWDAADELLLQTIYDNHIDALTNNNLPLLVINDSFGALSLGLHQFSVHNWTDSYLSHLAVQENVKLNQLVNTISCIPSTDKLEQVYQHVFIKIPKSLSLLEDQLCHLKPHINADTVIIASAMAKHIHSSTLKLFEKIIGSTTTSRAVKKARLILSSNDQATLHSSPYPKTITDPSLNLQLINHANVFAKDHLDIGTRFLIEQLPKCPMAENIIDLGCGNGALGITLKQHQENQENAHIHFIDESYMAISSAKESYYKEFKNTAAENKAHFYISNSLDQYDGEKPDLILCNPPFHQLHSIGDHIAWQMFKQSHALLKKGGELWVIGNRHLAYHAKLKRLFGNYQTVASNKKFIVISTIKS